MATITQANGLTELDTVYDFGKIEPMQISIGGPNGTWFAGETVDGGVIEVILNIVQPTKYKASQNGNNGLILCYVDKARGGTAQVQADIRRTGSSVGPNGIDLSSVTVGTFGGL